MPSNPEWEFMRTGYGECFDSFFAFGLISFAADSGFFPPALVALFDPIMQEEARHILFFANWVAYRRHHVALAAQPAYAFRRGLAVSLQVLSRIRTAIDVGKGNDQENFAMKSHESFGDISARSFLETCLRENQRRLVAVRRAPAAPGLVPPLARLVLRLLPARQGAVDARKPAGAKLDSLVLCRPAARPFHDLGRNRVPRRSPPPPRRLRSRRDTRWPPPRAGWHGAPPARHSRRGARSRAICLPMPDDAPVTTATRCR